MPLGAGHCPLLISATDSVQASATGSGIHLPAASQSPGRAPPPRAASDAVSRRSPGGVRLLSAIYVSHEPEFHYDVAAQTTLVSAARGMRHGGRLIRYATGPLSDRHDHATLNLARAHAIED